MKLVDLLGPKKMDEPKLQSLTYFGWGGLVYSLFLFNFFILHFFILHFFILFSVEARAEEYFEKYNLSPNSPSVDYGAQPLSHPAAVVNNVIKHDHILNSELSKLKKPLNMLPFKRGADMLGFLSNGGLDVAVFGDVPTITSASEAHVWIVGLVAQDLVSIVTSGRKTVQELKGLRIGYVPQSTGDNVLLQGLATAGLKESDVHLVPLVINAMPTALEKGEIDAFAGWEPASTIALKKSNKNTVVFSGASTDYFVVTKSFEQQFPEAALQVVASLIRAVNWLKSSPKNIEKAVRWSIADSKAFSGQADSLSIKEIKHFVKAHLLDIPSAPFIVQNPNYPPLKSEFQFLLNLKKLPTNSKWENIEAAFKYDGIKTLLKDPVKFNLKTFDYRD